MNSILIRLNKQNQITATLSLPIDKVKNYAGFIEKPMN